MNHSANSICYSRKTPEGAFRSRPHFRLRFAVVLRHLPFVIRSSAWLLGVLSLILFTQTAKGQGTLTNGFTDTGTISPAGDSDTWTFSANTGDSLIVRVGEITQTGAFSPRIRLMNPSEVQIASASDTVAAEVAITATNTGTFTVIVDDTAGTTATG